MDNPVDETVLHQLRLLQKEGKPDLPSMIVTLYLDTAPSVLKELETAASACDTTRLRTANHRLHSASTAVGAVRLSAQCNELEASFRAGSVPDLAERVQAIAEEYNRVEAALQTWCAVSRRDET